MVLRYEELIEELQYGTEKVSQSATVHVYTAFSCFFKINKIHSGYGPSATVICVHVHVHIHVHVHTCIHAVFLLIIQYCNIIIAGSSWPV